MQKFLAIAVLISLFIFSFAAPHDSKLKRNGRSLFPILLLPDSVPAHKKDPVAEDIKRLMPPVPPSFSSSDSAVLISNWTIGIKFYKSNCARCHGIFGKGKDSIPNFSKHQMDDYKAAFLAGDKINHAVMSKMTVDELNAVFLFITDIKRDTIIIK